MIRVKAADVLEITRLVEDARSYVQRIETEREASLFRLEALENKLLAALGEQIRTHTCYHICTYHPPINQTKATSAGIQRIGPNPLGKGR